MCRDELSAAFRQEPAPSWRSHGRSHAKQSIDCNVDVEGARFITANGSSRVCEPREICREGMKGSSSVSFFPPSPPNLLFFVRRRHYNAFSVGLIHLPLCGCLLALVWDFFMTILCYVFLFFFKVCFGPLVGYVFVWFAYVFICRPLLVLVVPVGCGVCPYRYLNT